MQSASDFRNSISCAVRWDGVLNSLIVFCVTNYKLTEDTRKRLEIMVRTNDGFEIAEADLKLRGPGDLRDAKRHCLRSEDCEPCP